MFLIQLPWGSLRKMQGKGNIMKIISHKILSLSSIGKGSGQNLKLPTFCKNGNFKKMTIFFTYTNFSPLFLTRKSPIFFCTPHSSILYLF